MSEQSWDAAGYARNARFVAELGAPLIEWLRPQLGEDILDLGCGDGAFTLAVVQSGARVVGVDSAPSLVVAAVAAGVDARRMDGQALTFDREFDAVISNAALHWMRRPDDVLAGVARALRPGGRFVAELGGHGNVASIVVALLAVVRRYAGGKGVASPWYFPTADEYAAKLKSHGFVVERVSLIPRPTLLPTGMAGWLETFAMPFVSGLADGDRVAALAEVVELLRPVLCDSMGKWTADYVRLRVRAVRAGSLRE